MRVATLPRLLAGIPEHGALRLEEHLAVHGEAPPVAGRRGLRRSWLIDEVDQAGLRGRGGGGFPTAAKMRAVAQSSLAPVVVVNATEGEPASMKDRTLMQSLPHLVLDGATFAAEALGATRVLVCVCESWDGAAAAQAVSERRRSAAMEVHVRRTPSGYVSGQESALVNFLGGGPALPTFTPPMPFERGVEGRPTLVCNAETFAHIALIARNGAQWFRQLGPTSQPGSVLLTLSGAVTYPGVYEVECGASLSALIDAAGGLSTRVRAVLVGGYAGTWIDANEIPRIAISDERLATHGASIGAGVLALLSLDACPAAETARLMRWLAAETAGQCGPCVNGLHAIATAFTDVAAGAARRGTGQSIARLMSMTRGRGACRHPDGAIGLVQSALAVFAHELSDHARHGRCQACARTPELPLPIPTRARLTAARARSGRTPAPSRRANARERLSLDARR